MPTYAARDTRRWLGVGGRSWYVAPRARAEAGKRPLVGTVSLYWAYADHDQRRPTRAAQASERRRAYATGDTRRWLGVGGRSWHVTPQGRAEGERTLAGGSRRRSVLLHGMCRSKPAHHGAREQCVSSLETASVGVPTPRDTRGAGLALGTAAGASHHRGAPKERELSLAAPAAAVSFCTVCTDQNQRITARASSTTLSAAPPP